MVLIRMLGMFAERVWIQDRSLWDAAGTPWRENLGQTEDLKKMSLLKYGKDSLLVECRAVAERADRDERFCWGALDVLLVTRASYDRGCRTTRDLTYGLLEEDNLLALSFIDIFSECH